MAEPPSSGVSEKAVSVLIVEDDEASRVTLTALLTAHGCLVRAVTTAEDAHVAALESTPDVVIAQLHLVTGSPGWTLARVLRENLRTRGVGLVAVTREADPRPELVEPFDHCLRSPVDVGLLIDLVDRLAATSRVERRRQIAERNARRWARESD